MKTKLKIVTVIFNSLFVLSLVSQTPNLELALSFGGTGNEGVRSMSIDNNGNIYTIGWFNGTVDFNPGEEVNNLTAYGENDAFIQKVDLNGNFLWAKQINARVADFSVDISGNVYTVGNFSGIIDFNPGVDVYNLVSTDSNNGFIQKLDTNGNFLWVKQINASAYETEVDNYGNVYTYGFFSEIVDFDPGVNVFNLTSPGSSNNRKYFIQKLDTNGNFIWAVGFGNGIIVHSFDGSSRYRSFAMATDPNGNVYTTGNFTDTVDFDPGPMEANLTGIEGTGWNTFIQKLDSSGNFIWVKQINTIKNGGSITLDGNNDLYLYGIFQGTGDFDPGDDVYELTADFNNDAYIQKLDNDGNFIWAGKIEGFGNVDLNSMTFDVNENVYVTGAFDTYLIDFDPGNGVYELMPNGVALDIFILKLDANGSFIWVEQMGGTSSDVGSAIALDPDGNIYTVGEFSDITDFDPRADNSYDLTSTGGTDIFIQKLNNNNLGIADNTFLNQFVVYPNPTDGKVSIKFDNNKKSLSVRLISILGQVMWNRSYSNTKSIQFEIDGNQGVYILEIIDDKQNWSQLRIIKE